MLGEVTQPISLGFEWHNIEDFVRIHTILLALDVALQDHMGGKYQGGFSLGSLS